MDWKMAICVGVLVFYHQMRKTIDIMNNTKVGGEVKQAVLDWIHRK